MIDQVVDGEWLIVGVGGRLCVWHAAVVIDGWIRNRRIGCQCAALQLLLACNFSASAPDKERIFAMSVKYSATIFFMFNVLNFCQIS